MHSTLDNETVPLIGLDVQRVGGTRGITKGGKDLGLQIHTRHCPGHHKKDKNVVERFVVLGNIIDFEIAYRHTINSSTSPEKVTYELGIQ